MHFRFAITTLLITILNTGLAHARAMSYGKFTKFYNSHICEAIDNSGVQLQRTNHVFGYSEKGEPLKAKIIGDKKARKNYYLISAMHGDERATPKVAHDFWEDIASLPKKYFSGRRLIVIPLFNPDGYRLNTRKNARKTDLNRDYPTEDGHEDDSDTRKNPAAKETRAFIKLLKQYPPTRVVSLHQPFRSVNYDGPAEELAQIMGTLADYPVEPDMGYPTPGSLGTYLGKEKKIPIITFELPRWMRKSLFPYYYKEARYALLYAFFDCLPVRLP